jgi:SAM-dependent methyltransferase
MSNPVSAKNTNDPWDDPGLIQSKLFPVTSHVDYPHLVDLNDFMKSHASSEALTILDYGAGASPYKVYFPNSDYRRADITDAPSLRYKIRPDSTIDETNGIFDLIISTQVAEHVPNPEVYFKECFRLLKPGGKLILSTHGVWDEHGSPYDFQRWTDNGLIRDLKNVGFKQPDIFKLTCGIRAALLIFTRTLYTTTPPTPPLRRFFFKAFRWLYSKIIPSLYQLGDCWFPQDKIVKVIEGGSLTPTWYIVIATVVRK